MNFIEILRQLFPQQPSLDEFISAHDPQTVHEVDQLTKQYDRIYSSVLSSRDDVK